MSSSLLNLLLVAALLLSLVAAVSDLRSGLIPNRLVVCGLLVGIAANLSIGIALSGRAGVLAGLLQGLGGIAACALLPLLLYVVGGLAGGDVKLFMALGALVGPMIGLEAQLYAFVFGALYAFLLLAWEGTLWRTVASALLTISRSVVPGRTRAPVPAALRRTVRFAPAICAGMALALLTRWSGT